MPNRFAAAFLLTASPITLAAQDKPVEGDAPGWAEVADGGKICLVTNTRDDNVSIISIAERKEILRLPTGDGPKHITVTHLPVSVITAIKAR